MSNPVIHPIVATCARGTERAVKFELKALGAQKLVSGPGAVSGEASPAVIAEANVQLRSAGRILLGLTNVHAPSSEALLEALTAYPFEELFAANDTFAGFAHLNGAPITHSLHAARLVKDAIHDRMRARGQGRPDVDTKRPTLRLYLYWHGDKASLSLDTSGKSLHKRGYRRPGGEAPMRETLAAAILGMAHADVRQPFRDPCCGTGTLGIEHAWRSMKRAAGLDRPFAIDHWADNRLGLKVPLRRAREAARDAILPAPEAPIFLSDWHQDAIDACHANVEAAGLSEHLVIERVDARQASYDDEMTVCSNLPFGERLGKNQLQLDGFYRTFGERLAQLSRSRVLLFSAHERTEYLLNLGRPTKRWALYSGPLKAMLRRWDIEPRSPEE